MKNGTFEQALDHMKQGRAAQRAGWEDFYYVAIQKPSAGSLVTEDYLYSVDRRGKRAPWTPSQIDLFATDWRSGNDVALRASDTEASDDPEP